MYRRKYGLNRSVKNDCHKSIITEMTTVNTNN